MDGALFQVTTKFAILNNLSILDKTGKLAKILHFISTSKRKHDHFSYFQANPPINISSLSIAILTTPSEIPMRSIFFIKLL